MLESLFNKAAGLQVFSYEYFKIDKTKIFYKTPSVAAFANVLFYIIFSKRQCLIYFSFTLQNCLILKPKITHLLSFVVPLVFIHCTTRCHSPSLVVIHCHSWSLVVSLIVPRCTTRFPSLYYSLSLVVIRCHPMCIRLSFYKRSYST